MTGLQFFHAGTMHPLLPAGNRWIMRCPGCQRDFMLPHRIVHDVDGITALNPNLSGQNSIICGYENCGFHFHLRGGVATAA